MGRPAVVRVGALRADHREAYNRGMVRFTSLPLTDPRLTHERKKPFHDVSLVVGWELSKNNRIYTGLLVIGQKAPPEGFETHLECYIDTPTGKQPPLKTSGKIVRTVIGEYRRQKPVLICRAT